MCDWRKIKNASSVLRHLASTWWESLSSSDKPHTWNGMKIVMRETFVQPSLVIYSSDEVHQPNQSLVIPLAMPNLLQVNIHKSEDDVVENEMLLTLCENSERSPITPPENESQGNAMMLTMLYQNILSIYLCHMMNVLLTFVIRRSYVIALL